MTQDTSDTLNTKSPLNTDIHEDSAQGDSSGTQDETEQLKAEIANLREQLARAQADYSNLVRRSREEQAQMTEWSENKTILKFLTILDNLERALEHTPEEFKSHSWTDGLVSIVRAMQKTVAEFGISRMNSV
jgi:molecular chaperone GrpE